MTVCKFVIDIFEHLDNKNKVLIVKVVRLNILYATIIMIDNNLDIEDYLTYKKAMINSN